MEATFRIKVDGTPVIAGGIGIGGTFQVDCANLTDKDPRILDDDTAYVRSIFLRLKPTFKNTNVGAKTIDPERLFDVIRRFTMDAGGHLFINGPEMGGQLLRHIDEILNRRKNQTRQRYAAGLVVPNGGTATAQILFPIFFFDPRGEHSEDELLAVKNLATCKIDFQLCQANEFDGTNNPAKLFVDSMPMPECVVEVVSRDEYRQPPLSSWSEVKMQDLEDTLKPSGVTRHDLFMIANNDSKDVGARKFAAGDISTVYYGVGSKTHLDTVPPDDCIDRYNAQQASAVEHLLAANADGTNDRFPIEWTPHFAGKKTKKQYAKEPPKLKITSATPLDPKTQYRLVQRILPDITAEAVVNIAKNAGHPLPAGTRAMPKTASKTNIDVRNAQHARNLPVVLVPPGKAAQ